MRQAGEFGRRQLYGGAERFQTDPYWKDHILFYEYFRGDNGAGLGAGHQTGWTGIVAKLIEIIERPHTTMPKGGQVAAGSELEARKPPLET